MSHNKHIFGIQCKQCDRKWRLELPLMGNAVEVFATICDCSAIIVGNYNHSKQLDLTSDQVSVNNSLFNRNEKYLSNGNFDVLVITHDELKKLPNLDLE